MTAIRSSLSAKILATAAANAVFVAAILIWFGIVPWPRSIEDAVLSAAGDRVADVSRRVALDLAGAPPEAFHGILEQYGHDLGVVLLLRQNDGERIAGPDQPVPAPVLERLRARRDMSRRPPPAGFGGQRAPPGDAGSGAAPAPQPPGPPGPQWREPGPPAERGGPGLRRGAGGRGGPGRRGGPPPPFFVLADTAPRYWIGAPIVVPPSAFAPPMPATLLIASDSLVRNPFLRSAFRWVNLAALIVVVSLLCWIPLLRGLTRTVHRLESVTARIAEGRFDDRVHEQRTDELGNLAKSINQMAARIDAMVSGQTRFLGDTAHELRSPLARMQVALEILEGRAADRDRQYVQGLRDDVTELIALTDDLLAFARAELVRDAPLEPVKLAAVVERAASGERRVGAVIETDVPDDCVALGHPDALFRAISNVLRNAVRYAGSDGPITAHAVRESDRIVLVVLDRGPGVPAEALDRVFAPFYRLDPSRARKSGGVGLGLAIARSAIAACGGTITGRNREPRGFEVRITLQAANQQPLS